MQTALSSKRSWIARIAVLAMVASLMAIAAPAGAAIDTTGACPDSIPDAGFTDLAGVPAAAVDAINCIADYEISQGTSATTFSPFNDVERWQMALFLTRQAEVHGVALPDGSDQGFTDLAGVPASAVIAINQTAQLNISLGTSATTFDPFADVERWQMALFLTRLVDAAGVTLPDGSDQGFTDLAGVPDAAVTAINQLAQLEISEGTTATTFDPFADVARWAMALFLTRTLQADGITPPSAAQVQVSPSTDVTLADGAARAFTATFFNDDGTKYTGFVGIELLDATSAGAPVYNTKATDVTFESVDGSLNTTQEFNGFAGTDGEVTFVVRDGAVTAATDVVAVAWIDSDGDSGYETTGNVAPTEPFGLSGVTVFSGAPAAESTNGTQAGVVVVSVDAANDSFVGDRDAGGTVANRTYNYDSNDIFQVGGSNTTMAGFEAELSETDVLTVTYFDTAAGVSTFNITTNNAVVASLKVTDPASATSIDAANYAIKGTGEAGYLVAVYVDNVTDNGTKDAGEAKVGEATIAANGTWSVTVPLQQGAANDFVATQRATASTNDNGTGVQVPIITEGAPAAATLLNTNNWYDAGASDGVLDVGDTIDLDFSETMAEPGDGDAIEIFDVDGTRVRLTCGSNATCTLSPNDQTIRFAVTLFPEVLTAGGSVGLQSPGQVATLTGFVGTDGLAVTGPDRQITEVAGPAPALP